MREQPMQDYQSCIANYQYIPENTEFIEALTLNIDTVSDIHYLSVNIPDANCQDICRSLQFDVALQNRLKELYVQKLLKLTEQRTSSYRLKTFSLH